MQQGKILFFCVLLLSSMYCDASEKLSLCSGLQSGPPYIYHNKSDPKSLSGIAVDLLEATGVEIGMDITIYRKPWKRCIFDIRNGYADGVLAAIWQPEREEWGIFPKTSSGLVAKSQRLWTVDYLVFTNKVNPVNWDGEIFTGVSKGISAPLGYIVFKQLEQQKLLAPNVYSAKEGFQLVAKNRLNGYMIESFTGKSIIKDLQLSDRVTPIFPPYYQADLHLVFSKKSKNITSKKAQHIWQSLAKVRNRDEAALREKYLSQLQAKSLVNSAKQ